MSTHDDHVRGQVGRPPIHDDGDHHRTLKVTLGPELDATLAAPVYLDLGNAAREQVGRIVHLDAGPEGITATLEIDVGRLALDVVRRRGVEAVEVERPPAEEVDVLDHLGRRIGSVRKPTRP